MGHVLAVAFPSTVLIATAFAVALAGLLQYRLAARTSPQMKVAVAIFIIGFGALLSVALTQRNLNDSAPGQSGVILYEDFASGFTASRWISLALIGTALIEIIRGFLRKRVAAAADPAWPLVASMLIFYLGTVLVQGTLSEHIGFSHQELYLPIVLLAVYYQPVRDLGLILGAAKLIVLALTLGSLLGIAVRPDFVMHRPEAGIIPGVDWRLFGLTTHANTLGPVALLGVLLELYSPSRRKWLGRLGIGAAFAVLVLAQSRTAWVAAALIAVLIYVPLAIAPKRGSADERKGFSRAVWTLTGCILLLIALAVGMTALGGFRDTDLQADLGTLNGRFLIWDITLDAWRENVLFGYGPKIWGAERQLRFNMFHVGHAHNQFLQTLGEAGLVGLLLLTIQLMALFYAACRQFVLTRGFVLSLLLLLLARCVTEAPLRSEGLLSWAAFVQVLLLAVACHHMRQPADALTSRAKSLPLPDGGARQQKWRPSRFSINLGGSTT